MSEDRRALELTLAIGICRTRLRTKRGQTNYSLQLHRGSNGFMGISAIDFCGLHDRPSRGLRHGRDGTVKSNSRVSADLILTGTYYPSIKAAPRTKGTRIRDLIAN